MQVVGVMTTASHNPIEDNGVKIIDTDGGMLVPSWEEYAGQLASVDSSDDVTKIFQDICTIENVSWPISSSNSAVVFLGRDTRPSSEHLSVLLKRGASLFHAQIVDFGLVTTPQLHYMVRTRNIHDSEGKAAFPFEVSEEGYFEMLRTGYLQVLSGIEVDKSKIGPLHLDCANGIGGQQAMKLAKAFENEIEILPRNTGSTAEELALLNDGVGAEHCQKQRLAPTGFRFPEDAEKRCASLDGDADRLVYHYFDKDGVWHLLDGDKIASLCALFVSEQLKLLGLPVTGTPKYTRDSSNDAASDFGDSVSVGVVQTAYANGASTRYIREMLNLPTKLAKTGVKYVHHAALEYDVGIYFEANGHGTVLFNSLFLIRLREIHLDFMSAEARIARTRLFGASLLINQAIGDALSDVLFVEAILQLKQWTIEEWNIIYTDLPSKQSKIVVKNKANFVTSVDETELLSPMELQEKIGTIQSEDKFGRAFIRPSGTEDVIRLYVEASTQRSAESISDRIIQAVNICEVSHFSMSHN